MRVKDTVLPNVNAGKEDERFAGNVVQRYLVLMMVTTVSTMHDECRQI